MWRVRPSRQNTIDDYREPIPAVRFLESPLCHRYTSCPILRPCSKLDMELHMTAMAALGGRMGREALCYYGAHGWQISHPAANPAIKLRGHLARPGTRTRAPALQQRHSTPSNLIVSGTRSSTASLSTIMNGVRERFDSPRGYRQNAGQN